MDGPKLNGRVDARGHPSMREVAELADVGVASVSRVLSGHPDVSEEMRQRVLIAVDELGYERNLLAQSLRRRETLTVGFVLSDIANPLLAEIVKGAEAVLRNAGYSVVLTNSEDDPDLGTKHVRLLRQRRVDGFILMTAQENHKPTIDLLSRLETPLVIIDREFPDSVSASYVHTDHEAGMNAAVGHLLDLGHRRIGLIIGTPVRPSRERQRVLDRIFQERGLPKTYYVEDGTLSAAHGAEATRRLLDRPESPTAIILGGNQLLVGALETVVNRGIKLGSDLSLISSDDTALAKLHCPPVSVVDRDAMQIGEVAAEFLLQRIRGEEEPSKIVLPTKYVPRSSCGPAKT
jgi:LacI family transcriptional regulator